MYIHSHTHCILIHTLVSWDPCFVGSLGPSFVSLKLAYLDVVDVVWFDLVSSVLCCVWFPVLSSWLTPSLLSYNIPRESDPIIISFPNTIIYRSIYVDQSTLLLSLPPSLSSRQLTFVGFGSLAASVGILSLSSVLYTFGTFWLNRISTLVLDFVSYRYIPIEFLRMDRLNNNTHLVLHPSQNHCCCYYHCYWTRDFPKEWRNVNTFVELFIENGRWSAT